MIYIHAWLNCSGHSSDDQTLTKAKYPAIITLEKVDDDYKKDKPYLDKITFQFYSDENTRVNALRAGDVDIIETVPWKDAESLESTPGLKLSSTNGPFMALQFNANSEPFKNPLVKQAIGYAIDRQAIINTAFSGRGEAL